MQGGGGGQPNPGASLVAAFQGPALLQGSMMAAARMDPAQVSDGFSGIDASQVVRSGHLGKLEAKKSPGRLCSCHLFIAVLRL